MIKQIALLLAISSPAYAKTHKHVDTDGRPMMRQIYAQMWKSTILGMFSQAGPTEVKLVKKTLMICNPHCDNPEVKTVLAETFGKPMIREKLKELDMRVECVSNALASN